MRVMQHEGSVPRLRVFLMSLMPEKLELAIEAKKFPLLPENEFNLYDRNALYYQLELYLIIEKLEF